MSEVVLSFGMGVGVVGVVILRSERKLMGDVVKRKGVKERGWVIVVVVVGGMMWVGWVMGFSGVFVGKVIGDLGVWGGWKWEKGGRRGGWWWSRGVGGRMGRLWGGLRMWWERMRGRLWEW